MLHSYNLVLMWPDEAFGITSRNLIEHWMLAVNIRQPVHLYGHPLIIYSYNVRKIVFGLKALNDEHFIDFFFIFSLVAGPRRFPELLAICEATSYGDCLGVHSKG